MYIVCCLAFLIFSTLCHACLGLGPNVKYAANCDCATACSHSNSADLWQCIFSSVTLAVYLSPTDVERCRRSENVLFYRQ